MRQVPKQFDIALSFAGEDRGYVEKVAHWLSRMGYRVFYDKYEAVTLWGKDLYDYLTEIYQKRARYTVMFCSKYYAKKIWTNLERRAAQAKAFESSKDHILPARFDDTKIPGLLPTTGYVELKDYYPKKFALLVKEKVGKVPRKMFFPEEPDLLYKELKVTNKRKKEMVLASAMHFWRALSLMTLEERRLIKIVVDNTCPTGPPDNAHLNIEYLGRLVKISPAEVVSKFTRLDCLGIETKLKREHTSDDRICRSANIFFLRFCPLAVNCLTNATIVAIKIFELLSNYLCPECGLVALESLDFSFLSSLAGFPEYQRKKKSRALVLETKT
jgi:hypothetical protein